MHRIHSTHRRYISLDYIGLWEGQERLLYIVNRYFARTIINGYLMYKKKLTIILLAPLIELYIQGCKLGFIIYKIKIKGSYEDRISSWVV